MPDENRPEVILGISEYNETDYVSTGRYPSLGDEVEVIEIAHYDKLAHLGDRWPVFTRIISIELLEQRKLEHSNDPQNFKENHLRNL